MTITSSSINMEASKDETPKPQHQQQRRPSSSSLLPRRVTIMATGTRGDIQPFVAVGIALKRAGCAVRVLTHPSPTHVKLCEDFGLEHVPFGNDSDAFMRDDKEARAAMETGDTLKFFGCLAKVVADSAEAACGPFCDEVVGTGRRPDLLIVSFLNRFFGLYARHVLEIPTIEIKLQHWVFDDPSRAPMGMPTLPLGLHRLIHTKLMIPQDYAGFRRYDNCIASILASGTADSPAPTSRMEDFLPYDQWYASEVNHAPLLPLLVAQPKIFKDAVCPTLPAAPSSPNSILRYVGPVVIETLDQVRGDASSFGGDSVRKKLEAFLESDAERKPIYMGWGSMIRKSTHEMALYAVEVLQNSRQRGIVLGGLAGLSMEALEEALKSADKDEKERRRILEYAADNVLFVDKVPHEWLFPRVALTVHHGGAGTLNASLRAGVPTIVTPVFGDQYDNSFVVQKLGVGFGFEDKLQNVDAHDLSAAVDAVLKDRAIADRAERVGARLRYDDGERGCRGIVREIETYWRETVASGDFLADVRDSNANTRERKVRCEKRTRRNRVMIASAVAIAVVVTHAK